ncbi:MAG: acyl-CoA-binding protein [Flavobacteriaceae bacterium]|nr:acyl-CoA-binding protein [Flavobacteriaceae bacterium]MDH3795832.1 acyl-CoA-binding protein [Flavobacteriaceae bacterium]
MKKSETLKVRFEAAVAYVNSFTDPIPADLLLKLYAYYKVANQNYDHPGSKSELINAFKANALIQAQKIKPKKAMQSYIELVEDQLKNITD